MKKNLISLAVAASVLGGAAVQAGQYVNPDKTGEVLLFPFYNADNGNATNMHIVNTTSDTKAIKIRFLEHKNSDEVLDFNLYLSPKDHFAFGVIKDPNGDGGAVITADNSCTVPALGSPNPPFSGTATTNSGGQTVRIQPFVNYQYATTEDFDSSIQRSLTGHVEVIEMGTVVNVGEGELTSAEKKTQYASFIKHDATGVPANCAALTASWAAGGFAAGAIEATTGGLYGLAYHINVEAAAAFGFEPTAIDDWAGGDVEHSDPGKLFPSITSGVQKATIHTSSGAVQYAEVTASAGVIATSATLMTDSISNDVMVNPAIGGMTDWVVTFPTKRAHVDEAIKSDVIPPFTDNWAATVAGATAGTYKEKQACEAVNIKQYNREELTTTQGLGFSPQPVGTTSSICNETAVIAMGPAGTASALSVSTGLTNLAATYAEGWQVISFDKAVDKAAKRTQVMTVGNYTMNGLPVIGFGAYKVNNGAMSYGNAAEHKNATKVVAS